MAELEDQLRQLSLTLPASHEDIAAVAEAAGQLGVQRQNIVGFTKVMLDLGNTTNLSADQAATSLAQLMNIMETAPDLVDEIGNTRARAPGGGVRRRRRRRARWQTGGRSGGRRRDRRG